MKKVIVMIAVYFISVSAQAFPHGGQGNLLPYLGPVATSTMIPNTLMASGSAMTRKCHIARDNISSLKLAYANWWVSVITSGSLLGGEASTGNDNIVNAWIEYPPGTYTQALFSSSTSGTITNDTTVLSDATSVTIPNGATFYTWTHVTGTGGTNFPYVSSGTVGNPLCTACGEASNFGVSPPASPGAISDNDSGRRGYWPVAILGMTTQPTFFLAGDSRTAGAHEVADSSCDIGDLARSVGPSYAYINDGVGGQRAASWFNSSTLQMALSQYASNVIDQLGFNEFDQQSMPVANVEAYKKNIQARFNGRKYADTTIEPWTSSTDLWATTSGQTPNTNTTGMNTYNDWIRSLPSGIGFGEISNAVSTAQDSGIWVVNGTSNYATNDGIHPTTTGSLLIPAFGGINPATIAAQSPISSSYSSVNLTPSGSVTYTTGPFGGTQALATGLGTIVGIAPGGPPMTEECWMKTSSASGTLANIPIGLYVSSTFAGFRPADGSFQTSTTVANDNVWHLYSLVFSNNLFTLYFDGNSIKTYSFNANSQQWGNQGTTSIPVSGYSGAVAECSMWNIAKYSTNFTPPVAPYVGNEAGLVALYHLNGNLNGIRGSAGM